MSEDNSWVFDSLLCFLHGPVWNAPLQTFIEEKSLIFDPNQKADVENSDYQEIYEEYKNLVDSMLGSFMEELHITPEQFETACFESKSRQSESTFRFHQGLFQQIWAANDIRIFIRMMVQRNVELQLQALDLLERRQTASAVEETALSSLTDDKVQEDSDLKNIIASTEAVKIFEDGDKGGDADDQSKFEKLNLFFNNRKIDEAEIEARQQYLRTQRDKIIEIKKKARAKQLNDSTDKDSVKERPTSSLIAKRVLEGHADDIVKNPERNEASIQLRKALAKRLRAEVVEQV